jgi:hypothetical protein
MSRHPQPKVGKWQFVYNSGLPVGFMSDMFTRQVTLGIFKLTEMPAEGSRIDRANYKGFILSWLYWWPLRRSSHL